MKRIKRKLWYWIDSLILYLYIKRYETPSEDGPSWKVGHVLTSKDHDLVRDSAANKDLMGANQIVDFD